MMPVGTLLRSFGLAVAIVASAGSAQAIEFRSIAQPSIMFDAPSDKGKRLFIAATGTPVEIIVTLDKWVKVRDASGALTWVERRALADERTVIVTAARAVARQAPSDAAPAAFEVARHVILDYVGQSGDGWVQVRHKDGSTGYLKVGEVWGR